MPYLIESVFKVIVRLSDTFRSQNVNVVVSISEPEDISDCACSPSPIHKILSMSYFGSKSEPSKESADHEDANLSGKRDV